MPPTRTAPPTGSPPEGCSPVPGGQIQPAADRTTLHQSRMASPDPLQIQIWPIDRFVLYARNPRKNDAAVDRMCASIRQPQDALLDHRRQIPQTHDLRHPRARHPSQPGQLRIVPHRALPQQPLESHRQRQQPRNPRQPAAGPRYLRQWRRRRLRRRMGPHWNRRRLTIPEGRAAPHAGRAPAPVVINPFHHARQPPPLSRRSSMPNNVDGITPNSF
jgi:hypothetical protein